MKFDRQFPIYNWLHPVRGEELGAAAHDDTFAAVDTSEIKDRAFYFHVPFCETICTFCQLNRGLGAEGDEAIEAYTQALIREIELKAKLPAVTAVAPSAIWFGGGTPTTLSVDQFRRIGAAIHDNFDLSHLQEFTIEMEVKSVTAEKAEAMREIGVNKARFGLQTFNERYRRLFNITATLDQTYAAAQILKDTFDYVSFDILYGMHGQTMAEFSEDIQRAIDLGTKTIEFYPVNHLSTQSSLHAGYRREHLEPLSYVDKMAQTIYLNSYIRAAGFRQHNGHGYVRTDVPEPDDRFISRQYTNLYHTFSWAYHDVDMIGFGASGISQVTQTTIQNDVNRASYVRGLLDHDELSVKVTRASDTEDRGLVLRLPYQGWVEKSRIPWDKIPTVTKERLAQLKADGLLVETDDEWRVTELGWIWYVNMMYYLSSAEDRAALDHAVEVRRRNTALTDGDNLMPVTAPRKRRTLPVVAA